MRIYLLFFCIAFVSCSRTHIDFIIQESEQKTAPATVYFENTSDECEAYIWDFGDGTISREKSPVHTFYLSGIYTVNLKGITKGKTRETKKQIHVNAPQKCLVQLETAYGSMLIELFDETPKHRDNFLKLAEEGFYDGLLFHRVIEGFMIQGGDPQSKNAEMDKPLGSGGPGYQIDAEFVPVFAHIKGALAAARTGDAINPEKRSSGSQFYIVQGRPVDENLLERMVYRHGVEYSDEIKNAYFEAGGTPFLDQSYTVFGRVLEGLEVIDKIAGVETMPGDRPVENISMKIRVIK